MIVRHLRNLWLTGAGNNRPDPFFLNTHFSGDLKVSDLARLKTRANQPVAGYQLIIRKWQDYKGIYQFGSRKIDLKTTLCPKGCPKVKQA